MRYEIFYVIGGSKEVELERIKKEVSGLITKLGGVFEPQEMIFRRALAYPIQHEKYGTFVAERFELEDTEKVKEMNEKLGLYPDILRYIISRTEDLPELSVTLERMKAGRQDSSRDQARTRVAQRPETQRQKQEEIEVAEPAEKKDEGSEESPEEVKPTEKPADKKISDEDIDKKLEEILNI